MFAIDVIDPSTVSTTPSEVNETISLMRKPLEDINNHPTYPLDVVQSNNPNDCECSIYTVVHRLYCKIIIEWILKWLITLSGVFLHYFYLVFQEEVLSASSNDTGSVNYSCFDIYEYVIIILSVDDTASDIYPISTEEQGGDCSSID